ncbi:Methionine--tRNA ligase [Acetobacteraceae bacterium EV16G]|uniref:Methionine--tRNA ligase n=1 Tax=Sorlinia euscelidii TaxID=3081148 RepID=A0ABU7U2E9_9PROT
MTSRYYVTTPIYYVNGAPHIGHAYTSVAADIIARFHRLDGREVFFLTGTDEHGQKVEQAAAQAGQSTLDFVDGISRNFKDMADAMGISYDRFIRTTEARHKDAAQALWRQVAENDHIYLGAYEGWYALRDECFYSEDEITLLEDGTHIAPSGAPVTWVKEESYFFRLSAFQDQLLALYEANPHFLGPAGRRKEIISFVKSGLRDLSISRTSFSWGIPVPGDPKHVMYVWFDALANYLSALGYPDMQNEGMRFWPANAHIVGKDIIRFHAVFWPAFLMAAGLDLPDAIFANGWWTIEGQKMSKSLGNVIDPRDLASEFGVDAVRFFMMREVPFGGDSDLSRKSLINRVNVELANGLGNLAQRTLTQINRHFDGKLPEWGDIQGDDRDLLAQSSLLPDLLRQHVARFALTDGLEAVWKVVRACNAYIDHQAPWVLKKTDPVRMGTVLRTLHEALRHIAIVLQPYMPGTMDKLLTQLGISQNARQLADLAQGEIDAELPAPQGLFPRFVEEGA